MAEIELAPDVEHFVLEWGELASHWGLNRAEAQIHALLFVSEQPLTAEEITDTLHVVRSHVSVSLRELLGWGIISRHFVTGERTARYRAEKDVWAMFRQVVNEQKRREFDPFVRHVSRSAARLESVGAADHVREQVGKMKEFLDTIDDWYGFIQGLELDSVKRYLRLGKRVRSLLGLDSA
jgi:DNA-binding transcriptional regulator GbsR (MarR family)